MKKNGNTGAIIAIAVIAVAAIAVYYYFGDGKIPEVPSVVQLSGSDSIQRFASYEEMVDFLKENQGSTGSAMRSFDAGGLAAVPTMAESSGSGQKSADYSTTNVQVAGVDEADVVKTDGEYIYTLSYNKITIVNAVPAEDMDIVSEIKFGDSSPADIFVDGDRLVVFGNMYYGYPMPLGMEKIAAPGIWYPYPIYKPKAFINVYDISDRSNPVIVKNITVDGNYVQSRMIGSQVYAIFNSPLNSVENITTPTITSDGQDRSVPVDNIYYFPQPDYSYGFTSILSLNVDSGSEVSSRVILMGASQTIYVSEKNIYITYQRNPNYYDYSYKLVEQVFIPNLPSNLVEDIRKIEGTESLTKGDKFDVISRIFYNHLNTLSDDERSRIQQIVYEESAKIDEEIEKERQNTVVHRIAIDNGNIDYKATGTVKGTVLNQFSMDEHEDHFRIATTTYNYNFGIRPMVGAIDDVAEAPAEPQSLNHLYVLNMDLDVVGSLENIAPDERLYSSRFIGDRAYLVTFKQVDPFFVIDLSEPTQPKVLGYLKIPGFSDYLHPYDETHIIGVGKETETSEWGGEVPTGIKFSLFDVSDVSNPREVATHKVGGKWSYSEALYDHKAFLFDKEKELIVIPITTTSEDYTTNFQGAYVLSLNLEDGFKLKGTVAHTSKDNPYGGYVRRSLYIGDVLYTVSETLIKANSLSNLAEVSKVEIETEVPQPIIYGGGIAGTVTAVAEPAVVR